MLFRSAIQLERDHLAPIREQADYIIDTTDLKLADLKHRILSLLEREKLSATIQVKLMSFGYKYGVPISADFIFDARFLPNPFYKKELRHLTGEDRAVRDYVMGFPAAQDYFERLKALIASVIPCALAAAAKQYRAGRHGASRHRSRHGGIFPLCADIGRGRNADDCTDRTSAHQSGIGSLFQ